jgi:hypothetical protein
MTQNKSSDASELDLKYFIDEHVYNCPFCSRRNVQYYVVSHGSGSSFDWRHEVKCFVYFVECMSCNHISMHLTKEKLDCHSSNFGYNTFGDSDDYSTFDLSNNVDLDDRFFCSIPPFFSILDSNIPKILRDLMTEAEGCLKNNFLTGASVCARKLIYEFANKQNAEGKNYEERIKSLKKNLPNVDKDYFDDLLLIHKITSDKVHEGSYDGWSAEHMKMMLATIRTILNEVYVIPVVKKQRRKGLLTLKSKLDSKNTKEEPNV